MRDITAELKALRLYGMAGAWEEVAADENGLGVQTSRWLIEHLLQAEHTDRHMRSVRYRLSSAKFPVHRDLAGVQRQLDSPSTTFRNAVLHPATG